MTVLFCHFPTLLQLTLLNMPRCLVLGQCVLNPIRRQVRCEWGWCVRKCYPKGKCHPPTFLYPQGSNPQTDRRQMARRG